jgi:hypothetical protein
MGQSNKKLAELKQENTKIKQRLQVMLELASEIKPKATKA